MSESWGLIIFFLHWALSKSVNQEFELKKMISVIHHFQNSMGIENRHYIYLTVFEINLLFSIFLERNLFCKVKLGLDWGSQTDYYPYYSTKINDPSIHFAQRNSRYKLIKPIIWSCLNYFFSKLNRNFASMFKNLEEHPFRKKSTTTKSDSFLKFAQKLRKKTT